MFTNFFNKISEVLKVTKSINVKNIKQKLLISILLSNFVVFFDILIIYLLSSYFQKIKVPEIISFLDLEILKQFLPLIVFLRFTSVYLDVMNIHRLRLSIEERLRSDFLEEIFLRGNFSISDSYFFINTLSVHISNFYQNVAMLLTNFLKILLFTLFVSLTQDLPIYLLFILILFLIPTRYLSKLNRKYSHISYVSANNTSEDIERVIDNLYLIKILKMFKAEKKIFKNNLKNYYSSQLSNQKYGTLNNLFPTFIILMAFSIILLSDSGITLFTLDVILLALRLFQSFGEFNRGLSMSISTYVHLEKYMLIEQNKASVSSSRFKNYENNDSNNIVGFLNVSFKYLNSDKDIFENLSIEIAKGKHTLITGPNGIGKSTFLGLASGVFYPNKGNVVLHATKLSYVSAYPMIIKGTLKENLIYGLKDHFSDEFLISKLRDFEMYGDDNIELNQIVSNKSLSSGQMQKVAFIRSLLTEPDLLILDEATSNLDKEAKKIIYEILNKSNLTILNSTHSSQELEKYDYEYAFEKINNTTYIKEVRNGN